MTARRCGCRRPSWAIISSVNPSLKYSCSGSPVKFSKGSTASLIVSAGAPIPRTAAPASHPHSRQAPPPEGRREGLPPPIGSSCESAELALFPVAHSPDQLPLPALFDTAAPDLSPNTAARSVPTPPALSRAPTAALPASESREIISAVLFRLERPPPTHHLIQGRPKTEDVAADIQALTPHLLRRHIWHCPHDRSWRQHQTYVLASSVFTSRSGANFARPKSSTLTCPRAVSIRFCGLMSR